MGATRKAIIIGAGPAGLTAALELLRRTDIKPIVLEASNDIGGLSRTVRYKGNRMDIGGHRFFSKSDRVMKWWLELMPIEGSKGVGAAVGTASRAQEWLRGLNAAEGGDLRAKVELETEVDAVEERTEEDRVMLIRQRKSRIYYLRKFFDYPIRLSGATLQNLGVRRALAVGVSYLVCKARKISPERSLADFLTNRFGRELYRTFFKSYTEKVWGTSCDEISAEWGAQRIKGLSLRTAVKHSIRRVWVDRGTAPDLDQKATETSLIERFLYPRLGPGQLWEYVASEVLRLGGEVHLGLKVESLECLGKRVMGVRACGGHGNWRSFDGDYFFSTVPMKDLVNAMDTSVPAKVREVSQGLEYRDFITVGLLCDRLLVEEADGGMLKDNWIYVQEPEVLVGRLQIFNNWSPDLVADQTKVWIGLEYFCYQTDDLWKMDDESLKKFAIAEAVKIGLIEASAVRDGHVVRVPKAYPGYFGTYERFDELRRFLDEYSNLFLIGRNGMHKYNNQDHSMLTAMAVVDGLCAGHVDKAALWRINTEQEYHEQRDKKDDR